MPRLKIKFSDGSGQEISFKGELVGIEIVHTDIVKEIQKKMDDAMLSFSHKYPSYGDHPVKNHAPSNMLGHWKTNEHFHIEIYELKDSLWLGRCKDCGEGKDKLIYDLNGDPVNYPEFGKLMNRLYMSESWNKQI